MSQFSRANIKNYWEEVRRIMRDDFKKSANMAKLSVRLFRKDMGNNDMVYHASPMYTAENLAKWNIADVNKELRDD